MTVLNDYWKHWANGGYQAYGDINEPEGHWNSYDITPRNKILEPDRTNLYREAFRDMNPQALDIMRGLCLLRVWTDPLAAHAVPDFDREIYETQMRALGRIGAVDGYRLGERGMVHRFVPSAAEILRENYDAENSDLCRRVRPFINQYFQTALNKDFFRGGEDKFHLLFWTDQIARLTESPSKLVEQYEHFLSKHISHKSRSWPDREFVEMFWLRTLEIAKPDTAAYAFFEHKRGASLFFGGTPQERMEGYNHIRSAYDTLSNPAKKVRKERLLPVLHDFASATKTMGRVREAAVLMEEYARLCQKIYAPDDESVIDALRDTSGMMMQVGRFSDCMKYSEEILRIRLETLGDHAEKTQAGMLEMSVALDKAGRHTEAAELRKKLLKVHQKTIAYYQTHTDEIGRGTIKRIFQAGDDAYYLFSQREHDEDAAHKVQDALLEICGKLSTIEESGYFEQEGADYGEAEDTEILPVLTEYAGKSWALSRENVREKALELRRKIIEHRLTLCEKRHENMPQGAPVYRAAPWGHYNMEASEIIPDMESLADDLEAWGHPEEAQKMRDQMVSIHEDIRQGYIDMYGLVRGSHDEDAVPHLENIIKLTKGQGRDEENLELRKQIVIEYMRQWSDPYSYDAVKSLRTMALELEDMGRTEDAEWVRNDVLGNFRSKAEDACKKSNEAMEIFADELHRMNRTEEELAVRRAILATCQSVRGNEDRETMQAADKLADLLHDIKNYAEELPLRGIILEWAEKNFGADAKETIFSAMRKAQVLMSLHQYGDATSLWLEIAENRTKNISEVHALLPRYLAAYTLAVDGKVKEALSVQRKTMEMFQEDNPLFAEAEHEGMSVVSTTNYLEAVIVTALCEMLACMDSWEEDWVPELRNKVISLFSVIQKCCGGPSPFQENPYADNQPKEKPTYRRGYFYPHDETLRLLSDMEEALKAAGHESEAQDAQRKWGNLFMMGVALAAADMDDGDEAKDSLHRAWELGTAEWGNTEVEGVIPPDDE